MKFLKRIIIAGCLGFVFALFAHPVAAQEKVAPPQITFDSFTGIYHLSRDSRGLSLLTSEETILADFPGNGSFYGITRSIPEKYQGNAVNVKVLNVTDAAGGAVPFKTKTDSNGNLVVTTGDPSINIYGSQTFKINYQTSGVINLKQNSDEFLLNVNGRGWDQGFSKVDATLYIPNSFNASLAGTPSCYVALNNTNSNNCQINTKKTSQETVITSRAEQVAAHQALVIKAEFKTSTFTNKHAISVKKLFAVSAGFVVAGLIIWRMFLGPEKNAKTS